jgi:hypothetical protein
MKFLLDTNPCIVYLRGKNSLQLQRLPPARDSVRKGRTTMT